MGTLVDFNHWGPLNHEALPGSFSQFEDEMGQFVSQTLSKNKISMKQIGYSVLGLAGVDTKLQHKIVSEILCRLGFEKFTLVNDAFLGIPAGSPTGIGICAINGTGCTLAGINSEGKTLQIGGVGFISADLGGGGMMSQMVVSSVYSELFRKGEPTSMTPAFFKKLGITSKYDFVEKIYEKMADLSFEASSCQKMLFEAVAGNDKVAAGILCDVATSYGRGISCMIEEVNYRKDEVLHIVLAGSVFVKGEHPFLIEALKEVVSQDKPDYRINYTKLEVPPVAGAVIWALNTLNGQTGYFEKVSAQLAKG
jgi:N-acetylglucosamine kinase-like BadF-type ATPase